MTYAEIIEKSPALLVGKSNRRVVRSLLAEALLEDTRVSYTDPIGRQLDGEGGFFIIRNVVYSANPLVNGTTFMHHSDASPEEIQAAAEEKVNQFNRLKSGVGGQIFL